MSPEPACEITLLFPKEGKTICRLPSLAVTPQGTILAFAQRRIDSVHDHGHPSEIVLRRSTDGGKTWTDRQTLASDADTDYHNGPVVVDRETGRIFKFYRKEPAWVSHVKNIHERWATKPEKLLEWGLGSYVIHSDDEGESWSDPVRIEACPPETIGRNGIGNAVHGIQMPDGTLVLQADCWTSKEWGVSGRQPSMSYLLLSTDHGKTWNVGPKWNVGYAAMEFALLAKEDGTVLVNQRTLGPVRDTRTVNLATGAVSEAKPDEELAEPTCHASLCRLTTKAKGVRSRILFVNPANRNTTGKYQGATRTRLTVRLSYDEGATWPVAKVVEPGKAGYADIAALPDGTIFCLFENGKVRYDDQISIARFSLEWLTDGKDRMR